MIQLNVLGWNVVSGNPTTVTYIIGIGQILVATFLTAGLIIPSTHMYGNLQGCVFRIGRSWWFVGKCCGLGLQADQPSGVKVTFAAIGVPIQHDGLDLLNFLLGWTGKGRLLRQAQDCQQLLLELEALRKLFLQVIGFVDVCLGGIKNNNAGPTKDCMVAVLGVVVK